MKPVVILGVFVADLAGPGGKGSNQAVAAKRAGAEVSFIAMLGEDAFAQIALDLYSNEGVNTDYVFQTKEQDTGAADIIIDDVTGNLQGYLVQSMWKRPLRELRKRQFS